MLSSYNLKNKQTIQISGLILQYCSATTLYRRLVLAAAAGLTHVLDNNIMKQQSPDIRG